MNYKIYGESIDSSIRFQSQDEFSDLIDFNKSITVATQTTRGANNEISLGDIESYDAISVEYEDGGFWIFSPEDYKAYIADNQSKVRGDDNTIIINPYLTVGERSIGNIREKIIDYIAFSKTTSFLVKSLAKKLENFKLESEGIFSVLPDFRLENVSSRTLPSKKHLLLIHGTNSSTNGFIGLKDTSEWTSLQNEYDNNILTFQHRTLSKSVLENAWELYNLLPNNCELDILTHSRGGLVSELLNVLCEEINIVSLESSSKNKSTRDLLLEYAADHQIDISKEKLTKKIRINKIVRVACPAAGTSLLGNNIPQFLNSIFNLADASELVKYNQYILACRVFISVLIRQKDNPKALPGIYSMVPNTDLLNIINLTNQVYKTPLISIQGLSNPSNLKDSIKAILANWVFEMANDFVVDTDSMNQGLRRESFYYSLQKDSGTNHFRYFSNASSRAVVSKALILNSNETWILEFDKLILEEQDRGWFDRGVTPPNSEPQGTKPIIVLIPGILGSALEVDDELVWVHYLQLAFGDGLNRLDTRNSNIHKVHAVGGDGKSYNPFIEKFQESFDVVVFAFDWRKSVVEESEDFISFIENLNKLNQTIHIFAHSMGGLVARELMIKKPKLQKTLKDRGGKIVLLGTPWQGSYLIVEALNASGKRFSQLHALTFTSHPRKKSLLQVIHLFKGLYDLLPLYRGDFELKATWEEMSRYNPHLVVPSDQQLSDFGQYKNRINEKLDKLDYENVIYIVGYSSNTVDNYYCLSDGVHFLTEIYGDGSVTWDSGIPKKVSSNQVFYTNVAHGSLCEDNTLFDGYLDILNKGNTDKNMSNSKDIVQLVQPRGGLPNIAKAVYGNRPSDILRDLMDRSEVSSFQNYNLTETLHVEIVNGHMKYAKHPILIGHFFRDNIVSAESVMDDLANGLLSKRNSLNAYPGQLGTSFYFNSEDSNLPGTIIVGLGNKNEINPQRLQFAIEQGVIEYLLNIQTEKSNIGISSLIIGSGYGDLAMSECVNAILQGAYNANVRFREVFPNQKIVETLEIIELYKDKAEQAYYFIEQNNTIYENINIKLKNRIDYVRGKVEYAKYGSEKRWWHNITVKQLKKDGSPTDEIEYSHNSKIARVESQRLAVDTNLVELLMGKIDSNTDWKKDTIQAAFRLLIPKELQLLINGNNGIVWILDEYTARYPWELIFFEKLQDKPTSVKAGMIRQLNIQSSKPVKYVNKNYACVLADPELSKNIDTHTDQQFGTLPQAVVEGKMVLQLMQQKGYETTDLIQKRYDEILPSLLLNRFKILHFACHGVIDYGPKKQSGIVLDYNAILTSSTLSNLDYMPDFVFINCCYSGYISDKDKNVFSANVGLTLIEYGVKAVIVGAWKIDDGAASLFSKHFYELFLQGYYFGDAVTRAREICYNRYTNGNTWAAYQCYGNQYYQLRIDSEDDNESIPKYRLNREIHRDLEKLMNNSASPRYRDKNLIQQMHHISNAIDKSGLRDAPISENEAAIYAELGDYYTAISIFESMIKSEDQKYNIYSLNYYRVLKVKYLLQQCTNSTTKTEKKKLLSEIDRHKNTAERVFLDNQSETNTIMFNSILKSYLMAYADCHKDKDGKLSEQETQKYIEILKQISKQYYDAYLLSEKDEESTDSHTLCAAIYTMSLQSNNIKTQKNKLSEMLHEDVDMYLHHLPNKLLSQRKKRFWDEIKLINILEAKLAFMSKNSKAEINEMVENIITNYRKLWKTGGSVRNVMAEVDQLDFMIISSTITNAYSPYLIQRLRDLRDFYLSIIDAYYEQSK